VYSLVATRRDPPRQHKWELRVDEEVQDRCPYPQVARDKGQGSIDDGTNFSCVAPK